jgi:hypothetical protein
MPMQATSAANFRPSRGLRACWIVSGVGIASVFHRFLILFESSAKSGVVRALVGFCPDSFDVAEFAALRFKVGLCLFLGALLGPRLLYVRSIRRLIASQGAPRLRRLQIARRIETFFSVGLAGAVAFALAATLYSVGVLSSCHHLSAPVCPCHLNPTEVLSGCLCAAFLLIAYLPVGWNLRLGVRRELR